MLNVTAAMLASPRGFKVSHWSLAAYTRSGTDADANTDISHDPSGQPSFAVSTDGSPKVRYGPSTVSHLHLPLECGGVAACCIQPAACCLPWPLHGPAAVNVNTGIVLPMPELVHPCCKAVVAAGLRCRLHLRTLSHQRWCGYVGTRHRFRRHIFIPGPAFYTRAVLSSGHRLLAVS